MLLRLIVALRAAPGARDELESRFVLKDEPTPGEGGRPDEEASVDEGGGEVPRMEVRELYSFGEAARTVALVDFDGDDGTARLLDEPPDIFWGNAADCGDLVGVELSGARFWV